MILISTSIKKEATISDIINKEFRLNELVKITTEKLDNCDFEIDENIVISPDWKNNQPPILFPEIPFNENVLLGIIYTKLHNFENAYPLLASNQNVLFVTDILNRLQNGVEIDFEKTLTVDAPYYQKNNLAIILQYGNHKMFPTFNEIQNSYKNTLASETTLTNKAFTTKHYAQFLADHGFLNEAAMELNNVLNNKLNKNVEIEIKSALCSIRIKQIRVPYKQEFLNNIKDTLWSCLQYYETENREVDAALLLSDAAYIATISKSYSEALGYANKACTILQTENLAELFAEAQLRKANVLQTWAADGNPQFFRAAMQSCLESLKIYSREVAPDKFADIQHQLGIIYAEIPDEVKKKGIWAAVSVSSFNEALNFYNKIDYPYEFAMICQSQANAYTKYPTALHTDNFDKALSWYNESLDIRTAEKYPNERVQTLLDYLEASWYTGNKTEFDENRYYDMHTKAKEILQITQVKEWVDAANLHLQKLKELKEKQVEIV